MIWWSYIYQYIIIITAFNDRLWKVINCLWMASRRCMWTPPPDFSRSLPSRPSQKSTSTTKDKQQQHQQQTTTTSSSRTSSFTSTNNYDNYNGVQTLHVDSSIRFLSAFHPSDFSTITVIINIIININTNHIRNSNDNSGCNNNHRTNTYKKHEKTEAKTLAGQWKS